MTDHPDVPQDLDELASAHLDGRSTPEQAALVERDPALAARVEALARVRGAIRSLEPPPDSRRREAAITAALAAFDEGAAATVTPLADVARRRGRDATWARRIAIAAAVALVALSVPLLGSLDSGDRDESTATREESAPEVADGFQETGGALDEAATSTTLGLQLGDYGTVAELAQAVGEHAAQPMAGDVSAGSAGGTGGIERDTAYSCELGTTVPPDGTVVLSGTASVAGRAVAWAVYEAADGGRSLLVQDQATCEVTSTTV